MQREKCNRPKRADLKANIKSALFGRLRISYRCNPEKSEMNVKIQII